MNKRLRAFTIMEITIAMLLAALVTGIAYTCFNIVAKSYLGFKTRQSQLVEISQLTSVLNRDMDEATIINYADHKLSIKKPVPVFYMIDTGYVLRIGSAATDTFKIKTNALKTLFEGRTAQDFAIDEENTRIDEISFDIISGDAVIPFHYCKLYSSQDLINRNSYAQH